jgi:hypothetical protein
MTWVSTEASSWRARAWRSRPRSSRAGAAALTGVPSSSCMTSTRSPHRGWWGRGSAPCRRPTPPPRPCWRPRCGSPAPRGRVGEPDGQLADPDRARPAGASLQGAGQAGHDVQVALDHRPDGGPLDLDRDLCPGPQPGRVHLSDRGGGQGLPVEVGQHLVDRPAQVGRQHLLDLVPGGRGDVVLESPQFLDDLGREQVRAGGQRLTELDEGAPGLLQCQPDERASRARPAGESSSARRRPRPG